MQRIKSFVMNLQRTDPLTNAAFTARRANQKHLTASNRMKYWNTVYYALRKEKEKILKPINQNFKVLNELMNGLNEKKINKHFLEGKGFDFRYFTHQRIVGDEPMPCYFSFLIVKTSEPDYLIIKRLA